MVYLLIMRNPDRREYFRKVLRDTQIKFYRDLNFIYTTNTTIDQYIDSLIKTQMQTVQMDKGEAKELWYHELENALYDEYLKVKDKVNKLIH